MACWFPIVNAARRWIVITTVFEFSRRQFIRFAVFFLSNGLSMLERRSNLFGETRVLSDWFLIWSIRHLENVFYLHMVDCVPLQFIAPANKI